MLWILMGTFMWLGPVYLSWEGGHSGLAWWLLLTQWYWVGVLTLRPD